MSALAQKDELGRLFFAFSDRNRRGIMAKLAISPATMTEIAEPLDLSLQSAWKHVKVLEEAGLVTHQKAGRTRTCRLEAEPIQALATYLDHYREFWEHNLDNLEAIMKSRKSRRK